MPFFFGGGGGGGGGGGKGVKHYVLCENGDCLPLLQKKKENPVGKKGNTTFWVVVAENFWEQRNI